MCSSDVQCPPAYPWNLTDINSRPAGPVRRHRHSGAGEVCLPLPRNRRHLQNEHLCGGEGRREGAAS